MTTVTAQRGTPAMTVRPARSAAVRLLRAEVLLMARDPLTLTFVFAFPVVTMLWNSWNIVSTSAAVLPFTWVVISEALACEMAQPEPSKEISAMRSPSTRR